MKSIKNIKILTIWLLMVLTIRFGETTKELPTLQRHIDGEIQIKGAYPKVGETFNVVYQIKIKEHADWTRFKDFFERDYVAVIRCNPSKAIRVVGQDQFFFSGLTPGETKEFHTCCQILEPAKWVNIDGDIELVVRGKNLGAVATYGDARLWLIDPETGQYGSTEVIEAEYESIVYRYEATTFGFMSGPDPAVAEINRKVIVMMRKMEPTLSDSEALLLHSDIALVGAPPEYHPRKVEEGMLPGEEYEEFYKYYLEKGWLKAVREGKHEDWIIQMKNSQHEGGDSRINFFRPDNNTSINFTNYTSDSESRSTIIFTGIWRYKNHSYNKDQGLLASAITKPIPQIKARVFMTYWYGGVVRRVTFDYATTDSNGWFQISDSFVPYGAENLRACPVIYPSGPNPANPMINVSDPDITILSYWKDLDDSTLFVMRELGIATMHLVDDTVTGNIEFDFDTIWTDTFPQVAQPQSGSINIYENYLYATTLVDPPPSSSLRILWETVYTHGTQYNQDTIWIHGDTSDTDEWDDDVLLHEFGHYLMDNYAEFPQGYNPNHVWYLSDSAYPGTAYMEGWPTFFSGRVRAGSGTDSFYVDNKYIESGSALLWRNIENPWIGTGYDTLDFQGGPWCEGAVCGVLWDIYDSYDEIPYHSYPDSLHGVWFPDTAVADSITMGFEEIWNIFNNYDPPDTPTHCWTIFDVRSGWACYEYGHYEAVDQILLHHRIKDDPPAAPESLTAQLENYKVRLYWAKNSESDLKSYRIYRKGKQTLGIGQWPDWSMIADLNGPNDTTYLDDNVSQMWTYRYRVTAYDTLGNESEYSDSVQISIPQKKIDGPPPIDLGRNIVKNINDIQLIISPDVHDIAVNLYDCSGRLVYNKKSQVHNNQMTAVQFNDIGSKLAAGVYFIVIDINDNDRTIEKIVIVQ